MTLLDAILSALDALRLHKLRSALTMLGIVIGVAAVIAMVAVGGGAREQVVAQIRSLGANLLIVLPGNVDAGRRAARRRRGGIAHRRGCGCDRAGGSGVQAAAPFVRGNAQMVATARTGRPRSSASISAGSRRANGTWRSGRVFEPEEIARGAQVACSARPWRAAVLWRPRSGRPGIAHPQRAVPRGRRHGAEGPVRLGPGPGRRRVRAAQRGAAAGARAATMPMPRAIGSIYVKVRDGESLRGGGERDRRRCCASGTGCSRGRTTTSTSATSPISRPPATPARARSPCCSRPSPASRSRSAASAS